MINHNKEVKSSSTVVKNKRQIIVAELKTKESSITATVRAQIIVSFLSMSKPGDRAAVDTKSSMQRFRVDTITDQIK